MSYNEVDFGDMDDFNKDVVTAVINEGIMREAERVEDKLRLLRGDAIIAGDKVKEGFIDYIMRELGYIL